MLEILIAKKIIDIVEQVMGGPFMEVCFFYPPIILPNLFYIMSSRLFK
jgi:hypothetical protein